MKSYLVLLPIFLLALLQGAVLPLNLVLLVVLIWVAIRPPKEGLLVAFFSGIFLDLAHGNPLGISSLLLLITSYLLLLYSRRFSPIHPVFLPVFVFLSSNLYSLVTDHFFSWLEGLVLAILALIFGFLGKFFLLEVDREKIKLKI